MKRCIHCLKNPEGYPIAGVTPSGGRFISRACAACQQKVDRQIQRMGLRVLETRELACPSSVYREQVGLSPVARTIARLDRVADNTERMIQQVEHMRQRVVSR